jgi:hypothetical protein
MHQDSWTCLMVENGPGTISDEIRAALTMAACELHLSGKDKMMMDSGVCEGIIQTAWTTHMVGMRSGVLFRAHVTDDTADGYKVNFLINTDDLSLGADLLRRLKDTGETPWGRGFGQVPCPELHQFYDLRTPARMLN